MYTLLSNFWLKQTFITSVYSLLIIFTYTALFFPTLLPTKINNEDLQFNSTRCLIRMLRSDFNSKNVSDHVMLTLGNLLSSSYISITLFEGCPSLAYNRLIDFSFLRLLSWIIIISPSVFKKKIIIY